MTELITTLQHPKMTRKLQVGHTYLRADGGIVEIIDSDGEGRRPMRAVRVCSGKDAGFYSRYGSKCLRNSGDAPAEKGLNIVGEIVQ